MPILPPNPPTYDATRRVALSFRLMNGRTALLACLILHFIYFRATHARSCVARSLACALLLAAGFSHACVLRHHPVRPQPATRRCDTYSCEACLLRDDRRWLVTSMPRVRTCWAVLPRLPFQAFWSMCRVLVVHVNLDSKNL